ncbi:patatin-like phospholipase family protein [Demequina aurantiaca]|uniref:patatin-like phospholipase family protein n=1 Tax=Demequina aurantiaca TaxID=676200 RepID=UPI0007867E22|nr:patatin-like phospholipase family protein [Demequina aurantiaca]
MIRHDDLRYEPHLALALGGGGALGAAHVGVLQVLRERGITPSIVVGTSIGSVMGAAYAAEIDPYELEELVLNADWGDFGTFSIAPSLGLLNTEGLRKSIETVVGTELIENLPIRYGAIASDLAAGKSVLMDRGPLYPAVAASIAVPGIFAPTKLDGHLLLDGGIYENLPLEAAFEMGAHHVIGVRLAPEWDAIPSQYTSVKVHELEIRSDVTLISPKLQHRSQWVKKDLPGLVLDGRQAAERALEEYAIVTPRPAAVVAVPDGMPLSDAVSLEADSTAPVTPEGDADSDFTEYHPSTPADADGGGHDDVTTAEATAAPETPEPAAPEAESADTEDEQVQHRGLAAFFRRR